MSTAIPDVASTTSSLLEPETQKINLLLVDDQKIIAEFLKRMMEPEKDIVFHYCSDPDELMIMVEQIQPTIILQDLVMPKTNGLTLLKDLKANPKTHNIPVIVLSNKEEPKIKAEAFALGAADYIVKFPDKVELMARVRHHSAGYISWLQRNRAFQELEEAHHQISAELSDAAEYVISLLPPPVDDECVNISWKFIPSSRLGGDCFGYHWLDQEHLAIYLMDVCGHGVGAALLSVTAMNVLLSQALPNLNFRRPSDVLEALNQMFLMEKHHNLFFTAWYGVFNKTTRKLTYASGGHPPAILITGDTAATAQLLQLQTKGTVIGGLSDSEFESATCDVGKFARLFVFSDGVFELVREDGTLVQFKDFVDQLSQIIKGKDWDVDELLVNAQQQNGLKPFADDFSMVRIQFK